MNWKKTVPGTDEKREATTEKPLPVLQQPLTQSACNPRLLRRRGRPFHTEADFAAGLLLESSESSESDSELPDDDALLPDPLEVESSSLSAPSTSRASCALRWSDFAVLFSKTAFQYSLQNSAHLFFFIKFWYFWLI